MATQQQIAAHLDLSQPAVSQLVSDGVLRPVNGRGSYDINACRLAYIRHIREVAAGRSSGEASAPNLLLERARLARAQAEAQERKNHEADGQLIDMEEAGRVFFEMGRASRDAWLNWPSRTAPLIAASMGINGDELRVALDEHVHRQLADLGDPEMAEAFDLHRLSDRDGRA